MKKSKSKFSKYLNGGDPKKPIVVNDPKDPRLQAYQDSLSLYTTSQGVQNFYKNNPRYSFKGETLINKDQLVFEELEKEKNRVINRLKVEGSFATDVSTGNLINKESDYYQRISDNKFKQRELNNFQLNLDAPMQEFNRKIKPDRYFRFQENSENVSKGDIVGIYSYSDKIAPKPTQPVEYQKSSNQGTLLQGEEYKKKHPPIYLDNPKDPRIGGYAEEGNQYLYQSKPLPKENISRLKTKDLGLVDSNTSRAKTLPVNKTKFNTNSNYTITSGISKTNTTYFPDEELLNEAVTNLRIKYPKSVQSQKSKGTANYDFPGATNDEVMKFKNGGKLRKMPDGGKIKYEAPVVNFGQVSDNTKVSQTEAWLDEIEPELKEKEYLNNLAKKTGEINLPQTPRSTASKAWGAFTNPMTYLSYKAKGIDVPEHFEREGVNKLDYAANILNPFAIANSIKNIPSDIKKGEYLNAGLGAIGIIPQSNMLARGLNEGAYIGKQLKKSASLLNKTNPILPSAEEFSKLRNISKVSALAQESTITRPQLINRYLKSGLDEKTLQNLTGKTIKELEDELKSINNISTEIKDSKSLSPNSGGDYLLNQERINNDINRNINRRMDDAFRITPERREELIREFRMNRDSDEIDWWNTIGSQSHRNNNIYNTLRNSDEFTIFNFNSQSNPIRENIDKAFNNLNSKISTSQGFIPLEDSNSKSLLSSLFKGNSGKNKDIVDEMRSAESKLRNSPKGVYQTTSNLSDNSFTNQLPFYSKLENEGDQFNLINHGYVSTNQASYLAQAGVSGEDRVKYINGVIDSYNKGRKLKIPYAKINGEDVQIPNLSIKKNYKDGGWLDQL